jgi:hypothetical protein
LNIISFILVTGIFVIAILAKNEVNGNHNPKVSRESRLDLVYSDGVTSVLSFLPSPREYQALYKL